MSRHRPRPLGPGFIRLVDYGHTVVWVWPVPEPVGGLVIHVRIADLVIAGMTDVFTVHVLRGSGLLAEVLDKTHRIRWAWPTSPYSALTSVEVTAALHGYVDGNVWDWLRVAGREHSREPNWPGRHRRQNFNRHVHRGTAHRHNDRRVGVYRNLPRPVVRALQEVKPALSLFC